MRVYEVCVISGTATSEIRRQWFVVEWNYHRKDFKRNGMNE